MKFFAHLILVAVLAAFAASSVAYAASSVKMAATMIASGDAAMDMSDCDADSEAGEMGIACDFVCAAGGFAAVHTSQVQAIVPLRESLEPTVTQDFYSLARPPGKQPPRTLI